MTDKKDRIKKIAVLVSAMRAVGAKGILLEDGETLSITEITDERNGYLDRCSGYYDKWYRYNRSDEGKAYDRGVQKALEEHTCSDKCTIIEGKGGE